MKAVLQNKRARHVGGTKKETTTTTEKKENRNLCIHIYEMISEELNKRKNKTKIG
jgi:hypothetical protein